MKRRIFLSTAFATLVLPHQGLTLEKVFYTPGLAEAIIKEGKVVFWISGPTGAPLVQRKPA